MNDYEKFMSQFSDEVLMQFINDYEILEKDGSIGQCVLRDAAESWTKTIFDESTSIVLWMHTMSNYAYKKFAKRYIESLNSAK